MLYEHTDGQTTDRHILP